MNYKDWYWLNADSRTFLKRGYLAEGQEPEDRVQVIADTAEDYLQLDGYSERLVGYAKKGWISFSSPVWANFGTNKGLPVSCNGSLVEDTMQDILDKVAEIGTMTKVGAGTSAYFGKLRPRGAPISVGGESSGPVHFMRLFDSVTDVVSQSNIRRGSFAAYMDIEHPDIEEFLQIKDEGNPIQHVNIGVCVSDEWMKGLLARDPKKIKLWGKVIMKRFESGFPYIVFTDTMNRDKPQVYKDKNIPIYASNLCTEIALPSDIDLSFVCVLSSVNLLHYDDWKDTFFIRDMIYLLDAVTEEYIRKTQGIKHMERAHKFARDHRALGLGVLGWHSLLQSKMIAFDSWEAKMLNVEIWKHIRKEADAATKLLATMFGEPEILKGYGLRNTTLLAVAPTTSSSFILGQISPSTEPENSNYYTKNLAKGKYGYKNPFLKELLKQKGHNDDEVWNSILIKGGSVQHLNFLTASERAVFKTFGEISQKEIIIQAAQRQKYIDQAQSLNLMLPLTAEPRDANLLLIEGWELGIKSFYYQRGANPAQELARDILACRSCEA